MSFSQPFAAATLGTGGCRLVQIDFGNCAGPRPRRLFGPSPDKLGRLARVRYGVGNEKNHYCLALARVAGLVGGVGGLAADDGVVRGWPNGTYGPKCLRKCMALASLLRCPGPAFSLHRFRSGDETRALWRRRPIWLR